MFFGDGVYDVTFANNGRLFAMEDHLDRFYNSCRMMRIDFPLNREELTAEIQRCVDAPETGNRPSTGNRAAATVPVTLCSRLPPVNQTLLITVSQEKSLDDSRPLKLCTDEDTRFFHCNIKTLNLLPNVMASEHAKEAGCDESIFHDTGRQGCVRITDDRSRQDTDRVIFFFQRMQSTPQR